MSDLQKNFNDVLLALGLAGLNYETERAKLTAERDNLQAENKRLSDATLDLVHEAETLEAKVDALKMQLFRLQHPADVYATIRRDSAFTVKLQQCCNVTNNKHLYATPEAVTRLTTNASQLYGGVCLHMSEGFGVNEAWPDPTKPRPHNWGTLQAQLAFALRWGKPVMLNLYCPPWWMCARGTFKMTPDAAYKHMGRLMTSMIPKWQLMVEDGVTLFASALLAQDANAVLHLDINNEWKMFQEYRRGDRVIEGQRWADGDYAGTPGDVGDMDYPPYAALTIEAALRATDGLGIPRERVKVGGSYPVLTFQVAQNADSVPSTHPLYGRPYGTARKAPLNAFTRYLAYWKQRNLPLDYLTIDGGTRNKDGGILVDDFTNCLRFCELTQFVRGLATPSGYGELEIVYKEFYAKPQVVA